jgi:hypothetical protein
MPPDRTPDTGLPSEKADCPTCGAPKGKPPAGPCDDTYHASPDRIRGDGGLGEAVGYDFEDGVRCVVMHCCGFTFDAVHTDEDGGYSCPACAEISPGRLAAAEQRAQDFATKWADEIEKRQAAERRVEALREKARAVLTRRVEYSDAYRAYTRSGLAGSISTDTCRKKLDIARDKLERAEAELAALAQQGETP